MAKQRHPPVIIFLHLPKCGGHTIYALMQEQYLPGSVFIPYKTEPENWEAIKALPPDQRASVCAVAAHMPYGAHRFFDRSAYFTILRDPVSKVVSSYHYNLSNPGDHAHKIIRMRNLNLHGFARLPPNQQTYYLSMHRMPTLARIARAHSFRFFDPEIHIRDAYLRLALAEAKRVLRRCAVVGVQEAFPRLLRLLEARFGWKGLVNRFENTSGSDTLLQSLDEETRNQIERENRYDRALYEYARRLFQQQCAKYDIDWKN